MRTSEDTFRSVSRRLSEVEKLVMDQGSSASELLESVREAIKDSRQYFGPLIAEEIEIKEWDKSPLNH